MKNHQMPNAKKLSHLLIAATIAIAALATAVATQNLALATVSGLLMLVVLTQQNTRIESIVSQAMMPLSPLPPGVRGRTSIFIDGNNVDMTARNENRVTIDYEQLLKYLSQGASLVSSPSYYYASYRNRKREYLNEIEGYGYDIKQQEIKIYRNQERAKGTDIDPWMATDIAFRGLSAQKIVIVSGDGRAYIHALRYAKQQGKKVEVWFFKNSTSARLLEEADRFVELLELPGVCKKVPQNVRPRKRHGTNNRQNSA